MVEKKKKLGCLLFFVMICFFVSVFFNPRICSAEDIGTESLVTVSDDASLLAEGEIKKLQDMGEKLAEKSGWNVIVSTCDDTAGRTAQTTCEDYFNTYTTGDNGISCLVDMDHREIYLSTAGDAILYLNDKRIDEILDQAYEAVSEGDYAQCLSSMISGAEEAYKAGVPDNAVIYDEDTGERTVNRKLTRMEILIALLFGCAAGGIVFASILGKYRLKWGTYRYDFHDSGVLSLDKKEDRFVNQVVTHRKLPQNNGSTSSSGSRNKSTVHTGSGGRTFGGGGRRF